MLVGYGLVYYCSHARKHRTFECSKVIVLEHQIFGGQTTDVFAWHVDALSSSIRNIIHQGGTSSSKTYSIMQANLLTCLIDKGCLITVTSCDLPALKRGAILDTKNILQDNHIEAALFKWTKGDTELVCTNGSRIEFVSYDKEGKARSGRRDYLFVDEANTVPYRTFKALQIRTRKNITIAYNPSAPFWAHEVLHNRTDTRLIISGYMDNRFCPEEIRKELEEYKDTDSNYYKVYGLGLTGSVEDVVFNVRYAPFPKDLSNFDVLGVGLDWGFAKSPTAGVLVVRQDNTLYMKLILYQHKQLPRDTAIALERYKKYQIVADSASPAANEELYEAGFELLDLKKPRVEDRIRHLQSFDLVIDPSDKEFVREAVGYTYNKQGTTPIKDLDHCWDAAGYVVWMAGKGGILAHS